MCVVLKKGETLRTPERVQEERSERVRQSRERVESKRERRGRSKREGEVRNRERNRKDERDGCTGEHREADPDRVPGALPPTGRGLLLPRDAGRDFPHQRLPW